VWREQEKAFSAGVWMRWNEEVDVELRYES
jgi:hypothetical protein